MLQTVNGREVYVVDLVTMPAVPITWSTAEEEPYAKALDNAIRDRVIRQPGKYGIALEPSADPNLPYNYSVYVITE